MKRKMLSYEELAVLSRQLALIIDSDVSIQEGIGLIREQTADGRMTAMLDRIKNAIQGGRTFADAVMGESGILPGFYIDMVVIGEESGNLHKVLLRNAETYEKEVRTSKKIRSAVTYPVVLSILMLGLIILLITTVMPMFSDIITSLGGDMPLVTTIIVDAASFLGRNIIIIAGFIIAVILALDIYRNTSAGRKAVDRIKLCIPVLRGIVTSLAALRFARNMSMLIKSGIPTAKAMLMVKPLMGNTSISSSIDKAAATVNKGGSIRDALTDIKLFPGLLVKLLTVAESTGHVDDMFDKAADIMSEDLDNRLDSLTSILEPVLIIILSVILGAILLSVIFPVIGIMNSTG